MQGGTSDSDTDGAKADIATAGGQEVASPSAVPGAKETREHPRQPNRSYQRLPAPLLGAKHDTNKEPSVAIPPVNDVLPGGEQTSSESSTGAAPVINDAGKMNSGKNTPTLYQEDTHNATGEVCVCVCVCVCVFLATKVFIGTLPHKGGGGSS